MVSSVELYPSLAPDDMEALRRYEQQLHRASDEIICDIGAIALVGFNRPPSAEQFEIQDPLEAQFAMEAIPDYKRNTVRNLGSVATLSHYEEMIIREQNQLDLENATLGYAGK